MPRYFFNTRIGTDLVVDEDGVDLRDPDQAWELARSTIRHLLKAQGVQPSLVNSALEVTDVEGEVVLEFPFGEALLEETSQDVEPPSATRH